MIISHAELAEISQNIYQNKYLEIDGFNLEGTEEQVLAKVVDAINSNTFIQFIQISQSTASPAFLTIKRILHSTLNNIGLHLQGPLSSQMAATLFSNMIETIPSKFSKNINLCLSNFSSNCIFQLERHFTTLPITTLYIKDINYRFAMTLGRLLRKSNHPTLKTLQLIASNDPANDITGLNEILSSENVKVVSQVVFEGYSQLHLERIYDILISKNIGNTTQFLLSNPTAYSPNLILKFQKLGKCLSPAPSHASTTTASITSIVNNPQAQPPTMNRTHTYSRSAPSTSPATKRPAPIPTKLTSCKAAPTFFVPIAPKVERTSSTSSIASATSDTSRAKRPALEQRQTLANAPSPVLTSLNRSDNSATQSDPEKFKNRLIRLFNTFDSVTSNFSGELQDYLTNTRQAAENLGLAIFNLQQTLKVQMEKQKSGPELETTLKQQEQSIMQQEYTIAGITCEIDSLSAKIAYKNSILQQLQATDTSQTQRIQGSSNSNKELSNNQNIVSMHLDEKRKEVGELQASLQTSDAVNTRLQELNSTKDKEVEILHAQLAELAKKVGQQGTLAASASALKPSVAGSGLFAVSVQASAANATTQEASAVAALATMRRSPTPPNATL